MVIFYTFIYPNLRLATKGPSCTMGATTPQRLDLRCPVTQQLRTNISVTRRPSERASARETHIPRSVGADLSPHAQAHLCRAETAAKALDSHHPSNTSVMHMRGGRGIGGNLAEENRAAELP